MRVRSCACNMQHAVDISRVLREMPHEFHALHKFTCTDKCAGLAHYSNKFYARGPKPQRLTILAPSLEAAQDQTM